MTKMSDEQVEALKEIELYWRKRIAVEIFEASQKLKVETVSEAFEACEAVARNHAK